MDAPRHNCAPTPKQFWLDEVVDDPTPRHHAIYLPSVTPSYAKDAYTKNFGRPLPDGLNPNVFNFLDPANRDFFFTAHAMSSAGQALYQKEPCIINQRDRSRTRIIGDSGGFQIAGGMEINGDAGRMEILRWLESTADIAMTLDVPTANARFENNGYRYPTTPACLNATLEHLRFFSSNRDRSSKLHFLNVLQGNDTRESDAWYNAVKDFEFEGWAFAGVLRRDMFKMCRRIIMMAKEGLLQQKSWIHVLGTNSLDTAVMLSAIQQAINDSGINPYMRVSFDTSTPFSMLKYNMIFTNAKLTELPMAMNNVKAPADPAFFKSNLAWPWPSAIGRHIKLGDFCVPGSVMNLQYHDRLSYLFQAHHNLTVLCEAISTANKLFDVDQLKPQGVVPLRVREAIKVMRDVIADQDLDALERNRGKFEKLPGFRNKDNFLDDDGGADERSWAEP